ncbi:PRC and DUF2382 domain-containing protein [Actinosynnema sp. NPDC050436]|uniref:PRC and DUF2382 domain-containing protein n=1 Tax=Actinosynnema sp. NPDC050436 TaxID=3155659 RepID=UPI0033D20A1E
MINQAEVDRLYDCDVIDPHGERIGSVKQVWLDDRDGRPMWASVHTGLFGTKESFVPIQDAEVASGHITVPVDKKQVKDSPKIDVADEHMSDEQQDELYSYYGLIPSANTGQHDRLPGGGRDKTLRDQTAKTDAARGDRTEQSVRGDLRGQGTERSVRDNAAAMGTDRTATTDPRRDRATTRDDQSVTRYEERLDVGTREVEAGRVRLVKHIVTEERTVTVPVTHEEVRVVREPADGTHGGKPFAEEEAEVTLRRQEPVVQKHAEAVENVRLDKETVTEQHEVAGTVRREEVDIQRDDAARAAEAKHARKDDRA